MSATGLALTEVIALIACSPAFVHELLLTCVRHRLTFDVPNYGRFPPGSGAVTPDYSKWTNELIRFDFLVLGSSSARQVGVFSRKLFLQ